MMPKVQGHFLFGYNSICISHIRVLDIYQGFVRALKFVFLFKNLQKGLACIQKKLSQGKGEIVVIFKIRNLIGPSWSGQYEFWSPLLLGVIG